MSEGRKEGVDFFLKSNNPTPTGGKKRKVYENMYFSYAHMLMVVAFMVVNASVFSKNCGSDVFPHPSVWGC